MSIYIIIFLPSFIVGCLVALAASHFNDSPNANLSLGVSGCGGCLAPMLLGSSGLLSVGLVARLDSFELPIKISPDSGLISGADLDIFLLLFLFGLAGHLSTHLVVVRPFLKRSRQRRRKRELQAEMAAMEDSGRALRAKKDALLKRDLESTPQKALLAFAHLPLVLRNFRKQLGEAHEHFNARAFAPFWEALQKTLVVLAEYEQYTETVIENAKSFRRLQKDFTARFPEKEVPRFPISSIHSNTTLAILPDQKDLQALIYSAQRDFEFSAIYEQRRTQHILIAGFRSLESAIDLLGDRVVAAVADLTSEVNSLRSEVSALHCSIDDIASGIAVLAENSNAMREQETLASEKLSSIEQQSQKVALTLDRLYRGHRPLGVLGEDYPRRQ